MKKIISLFVCAVMMICACGVTLAVSLTCWYSNSTSGCLTSDGATIKICGYNSFVKSTLDGYLNYAVGEWSDANVDAQVVTSGQLVSLYCGDLTYLQSLYPTYQSNWRGLTPMWIDASQTATYTYNGNTYTIETISRADMYLLYRSSLTSNQYKNTLLHEIGHVVGWYNGHSSYSTDIMYSVGSSSTSLKTRDKNQVLQMYN